MKVEFSRQIFEKYSKIKFHENPTNGSRVGSFGGGRTDMSKLIVAFRNFVNAPKNRLFRPHSVFICYKQFPKYKTITSLHKFNRLGFFLKRNRSVFCAVRTESL